MTNNLPCEDSISREDARMSLTCEIKENMTITDYISMVDKRLRNLPSVQPLSVLDDIKAEIRQNIGDNLYKNDGLYHALQIIDKYTLNETKAQ